MNTGVVADYEIRNNMIDNQSGLGLMAGLGLKYSFDSNISVFINPYVLQHAVIAFNPENHQQRMLDAGVRLGVGLRL